MASQAEIDLLVDATRTLPDLERSLSRIISVAERNADDIDVHAAVATRDSLDDMQRDLARVIRAAEDGAPDLDLLALLDQQRTLTALRGDLDQVITQADNQAPDIDLTALLNRTRSLAGLRRDLNNLVDDVTRPDVDINARLRVDRDGLRDADRLSNSLGDVTRQARSALGSFLRLAGGSTALAGAMGSLAPLLAGVVGAIQSIAPAAALGTQAMLSMQLVSGTLKLAMVGVEDAITAAFDPEKAEEFQEALKKLAPEARDFVVELRDMSKELREVQQRVQNNFFRGFDDALEKLASTTGPAVSRALDSTSKALNRMALGAASAATELGRNGTLGQALESSVASLENLERVPGQATTAFGQLAASSGPAMERVTRAVQRASDRISGRLAAAFESGALEAAIDDAVSAIAQLGRIGGDILGGLRNTFAGLTQDGRGLFDILESITQAFEDVTASREFQSILGELALTADTLVKNILPLLREAFVQLAPVIEELGPPLRDFINEIGPELIPIIQELGPILLDLAVIFREQMPLAIELAKTALQVLSLVLKSLHVLLSGIIIPIVQGVARAFDKYGGIVKSVTGDVDKSISSLAVRFANFQTRVNGSIQTVISKIGEFAGAFGRMTSAALNAVVQTTAIFGRLPGMVVSAIAGLGARLFSVGQNIVLGLVRGMSSMLSRVRDIASEIASTVSSAVTNLLKIHSDSRVFIDIGQYTVSGFIEGIRRSLPELASTAAEMGFVTVAQGTPGQASGPRPRAVSTMPAITVQIGNQVIKDYIRIVTRTENDLRDRRLATGTRR